MVGHAGAPWVAVVGIDGHRQAVAAQDGLQPAMSSVLSWLADDDKAGFRAKYAMAREIQADGFVDEMVEIADDRADDWIEKKNASGETTGWQENGEAIRRSQLRIATRQWVAEKLKPKKYGSKVEPDHGVVASEVSQLLEDINGKTRGLPNGR
ncbi:terminase small subunit protein [Rhizobium leguminosarum]|uniref:Terminase small subunit protein n=1 Tax=Rhizobium leguminosarum TaxID=384 RepID=A0A4Q8XMW1_RHILE|nr:terminase small subunit protein [Rhizobium leguminosarum]TAV51424.1 terminase small subunit protein [Rhizobium leguminosarum]TAV56104.1 terminase small subunit protein [Rhizobium leguminosarum]TAV60782.1 terminase small subunit protein [Rhizobium leguminosarum]TAV71827.1 terminase small subunit protein [Rhizobium leguminosarum]